MIGKNLKGSGARGLFSYLAAPLDSKGQIRKTVELLHSTLPGLTPGELAKSFGALRRLRPSLKKVVHHGILSFRESTEVPEADADVMVVSQSALPDRETMEAVAVAWAVGMGFEDFAIWLHDGHLHVVASRVRRDGSVVSDSMDWARSENLVRKLEVQFGLLPDQPSHLTSAEKSVTHTQSPTRGELKRFARTGEVPIRAILQNVVSAALSGGATFEQFSERCELAGVLVRPNLASTGAISGLSFRHQESDVEMKASALGRSFSWVNLNKKGLTYERDDDVEAARRCIARLDNEQAVDDLHRTPNSAGRGNDENRRTTQPDRSRPGAVGGSASADRNGVYGARGGDTTNAAEHRASKPTWPPAGDRIRGEGLEEGDKGLKRLAPSDLEGGEIDREFSVLGKKCGAQAPQRSGENSDYRRRPRGSSERDLADLAGPKLVSQMKSDATRDQVYRQLQAMSDVPKFEIGVIAPKSRPDLPAQRIRTWTHDEILKGLKWLKRMNVLDYDCYIRPAPASQGKAYPYAFVDDLDEAKLLRMKSDGYCFAVLIESSPNLFHGWVRLGTDLMEREEVTSCARSLAETYGGDPQSADWRHFGRLGGLTNRKPQRAVVQPSGNRMQPFARLREISNIVTLAAQRLVEWIRQMIAERRERAAQKSKMPLKHKLKSVEEAPGAVDQTVSVFLGARARARSDDESAKDFSGVLALFRRGYSSHQVAAVLRSASPNLEARHRMADDYVRRTIARAEATVSPPPSHSRAPRPRM